MLDLHNVHSQCSWQNMHIALVHTNMSNYIHRSSSLDTREEREREHVDIKITSMARSKISTCINYISSPNVPKQSQHLSKTYFNQNPRQTGLNEQRTVLFSILVSFRNVTFDSHFFFSKDGNRSLSEHGNGSLEPGDNIYHDRKEIIVRISATL